MVRLAQEVASCVPIGAQRATNEAIAQLVAQQGAQHHASSRRESEAADTQPVAQLPRNTRATNDHSLNPKQLRVISERDAEIRALIATLLVDDSEADQAEASAVALADLDNALACFRALARISPAEPLDDRRRCRDCTNLTREEQCKAAIRGDNLGFGHAKTFRSAIDVKVRCRGYQPLLLDPDQHPANARWLGIDRSAA